MSNKQAPDEFVERFMDRKAAQRYHDRYLSGRHARVNHKERAALRELLGTMPRLEVILDLPSGTGRLGDLLAEFADRVILADSSPIMLEIAREDLGDKAEYLQTNAEKIDLPTDSVDLVLCHRLLNHVPDPDGRARMTRELARVSRRYVVISCYPPGIRTRVRRIARKLMGRAPSTKRPASLQEYIDLAAQAGLRPIRRSVLRRIPSTAEFVLFEHVPV